MLDLATGRWSSKIALLTMPPVIEGQPNPNGKNRLNADVAAYNAILSRLADEYGAILVNVGTIFAGKELEAVFNPDGIHPNADGHVLIRAAVQPVLERLIAEETSNPSR